MSDDPRVAELRKLLTFENYCTRLKINDLATGQLVTFTQNVIQRRIRAKIDEQLPTQNGCRLIILKARRMGVSTLIQASQAHLAFTTKRFTALTGAHEDVSSEFLHGMVEQMYENLPADGLKPQKKINLRGRRLAFTSESSMRTFTAGGRSGVARGMDIRAMHASEVAYWPDIEGTLGSVRQAIVDQPGTMIVLESTAQGLNGFHHEWRRAIAGESGYTPLFYAWFEFPDYRMPVPPGGLKGLDADEMELREQYGCDDEQLMWRRHTIATKCAGNLDLFHQEYPATDKEAFLSSGRPRFRNLNRFIPEAPVREGWFVGDPVPGERPGKLPVTFVPEEQGLVRIWDVPQPGVRYAIWADAAGSTILSDYEERRKIDFASGADAYAAFVINLQTGRHVAVLHGRLQDEKVWAWELARVGRIYNNALIAVEKQGGYGIATNLYLRDELQYPNIWREIDFDSTDRRDEAGEYGWMTTSTTRPQMIAELESVLREDPSRLRDERLKEQMAVFVYNKQGKAEADVGYHDDLVMSAAGCARIFSLRAQPIPRAPDGKKKKRTEPLSILEAAPRIQRSHLN